MSFAYTFVDDNGKERKVNVPDSVIPQGRREGLSVEETLARYLVDEGYKKDATVEALTTKAKDNGCGAHGEAKKKRKPPTRKPDMDKRSLIIELFDGLKRIACIEDDNGKDRTLENLEVLNPERLIAFSLGDDNYEVTLSKKRKPKA